VPLAALAGVAAGSFPAFAQEWVFANSIPCASAPVYGVPFSDCAVSNTRTFRVGSVRAWRLLLSDAKSEAAVGLYRLVEADGVGGMGSTSGMVDWLRSAEALRTVTSSGSGWALNSNQYVSFQRPNRQCVGFMRTGPAPGGPVYWILGGAFCRESTTPIPPNEAQFVVNAVKVRD
jgi:hypothetical protein